MKIGEAKNPIARIQPPRSKKNSTFQKTSEIGLYQWTKEKDQLLSDLHIEKLGLKDISQLLEADINDCKARIALLFPKKRKFSMEDLECHETVFDTEGNLIKGESDPEEKTPQSLTLNPGSFVTKPIPPTHKKTKVVKAPAKIREIAPKQTPDSVIPKTRDSDVKIDALRKVIHIETPKDLTPQTMIDLTAYSQVVTTQSDSSANTTPEEEDYKWGFGDNWATKSPDIRLELEGIDGIFFLTLGNDPNPL